MLSNWEFARIMKVFDKITTRTLTRAILSILNDLTLLHSSAKSLHSSAKSKESRWIFFQVTGNILNMRFQTCVPRRSVPNYHNDHNVSVSVEDNSKKSPLLLQSLHLQVPTWLYSPFTLPFNGVSKIKKKIKIKTSLLYILLQLTSHLNETDSQ